MTAIGDPVNEAARLSELAKARPSRVLASSATIELRGRRVPTVVGSPV